MPLAIDAVSDWDGLALMAISRRLPVDDSDPLNGLLRHVDNLVTQQVALTQMALTPRSPNPLLGATWSTSALLVILCYRAHMRPVRVIQIGALVQLLRAALNEHSGVRNGPLNRDANARSILGGDLLLSRMALLAAEAGNETVDAVSKVMIDIASGALVIASGTPAPNASEGIAGLTQGSSAFTRATTLRFCRTGPSGISNGAETFVSGLCDAINRRSSTDVETVIGRLFL